VFTHIVALLLSLAALADRAANLPHPVRWVVLRILRRAEIAGRDFVIAAARELRAAPWMLASAEAHGGSRPADAASLALSFRLLALALSNLSALARHFPRPLAEHAWPAAALAPVWRRESWGVPVPPDTS
jgi:hypothetical protein